MLEPCFKFAILSPIVAIKQQPLNFEARRLRWRACFAGASQCDLPLPPIPKNSQNFLKIFLEQLD
jgi:hypothetical protein